MSALYGKDFNMEAIEYIVIQIDGDYAHLKIVEHQEADLKIVARALLPAEIQEGNRLLYENFEYQLL